MARSLSSLFLGLLVLTLICLQGVFAYIPEGLYEIQTLDNEYLSIGPVPPVFPPMDVPARLSDRRRGDEIWEVLRSNDGGYTIRQRGDPKWAYGLNRDDNGAVIVSSRKAPQTWAVDKAGPDVHTIRVVNEDKLFTAKRDDFPQVVLRPADGSGEQLWRFIPFSDDWNARGGMYGKSRFNVQCYL
ncbi:hypothetical protein EMPS_05442 [Entomortierella parvispora]|uniref:Ricin B lectin domain-containing protein n=1 Tax=Entomortierella parvispora TaxID=205924 RepID=A0A9P3HAG6_9FUNG|nr:hypothetical protein EMPS_05442 [Entomortierella parvispora]